MVRTNALSVQYPSSPSHCPRCGESAIQATYCTCGEPLYQPTNLAKHLPRPHDSSALPQKQRSAA